MFEHTWISTAMVIIKRSLIKSPRTRDMSSSKYSELKLP